MPKAFVSYARDGSHGESLATEIQQRLQAAGMTVFRDVTGLKPGDTWYHKLEYELETSDVMVLVLSEKVRKSQWVYNEFSMAVEIGIPVIPVLAEEIRQPLWVRHLQILFFHQQADWTALLHAIDAQLLIGSKSVSPIEQSPKEPLAATIIEKPAWAASADNDQYGRYADLIVKNITQRFRYIEPGTFMMGSPDDEKERYDDEDYHQVTLSNGFWLADTACTQALWQAVMGDNPANFNDDLQHPVETVSWLDVQGFLKKLNQAIAILNAQLPSEAEWEYACRAGTKTPFSFGENITTDQVNYNGNVPYADGKKGEDRSKTVPVKALPANQWGLYQMHGNVWEWCEDEWTESLGTASQVDPLEHSANPKDGSANRVVRGGSWVDLGGFVRSAFRSHYSPDYRDRNVGFRLLLGH